MKDINRFWSIPILAIYVYAITILTFVGYNSYFGIPADFVEASIASNTLYLSFLLRVFVGVMLLTPWWGWLIWTGIGAIFLGCCYLFLFKPLKTLSLILIIPAIWFAWQSMSFGAALAKENTSFYIPSSGCIISTDIDQKYIVPAFYEGNAILVPIDSNNKMTGGFLLRDVTQLPCKLTMEGVGKISK